MWKQQDNNLLLKAKKDKAGYGKGERVNYYIPSFSRGKSNRIAIGRGGILWQRGKELTQIEVTKTITL